MGKFQKEMDEMMANLKKYYATDYELFSELVVRGYHGGCLDVNRMFIPGMKRLMELLIEDAFNILFLNKMMVLLDKIEEDPIVLRDIFSNPGVNDTAVTKSKLKQDIQKYLTKDQLSIISTIISPKVFLWNLPNKTEKKFIDQIMNNEKLRNIFVEIAVAIYEKNPEQQKFDEYFRLLNEKARGNLELHDLLVEYQKQQIVEIQHDVQCFEVQNIPYKQKAESILYKIDHVVKALLPKTILEQVRRGAIKQTIKETQDAISKSGDIDTKNMVNILNGIINSCIQLFEGQVSKGELKMKMQ